MKTTTLIREEAQAVQDAIIGAVAQLEVDNITNTPSESRTTAIKGLRDILQHVLPPLPRKEAHQK